MHNVTLLLCKKQSVREKSGQDLIKKLTGRNAQVVLDPVFLIEKKYWINLCGEPIINENYIFVYATQINTVLKKALMELNCKTKYNVISPFYIKGCKVVKNMGPLDFINYINNAEYIVTSSFHATAFSLIFEKYLYVVPHSTTGSRVVDWLQLVGLESKCIGNRIDLILENKIDYTVVNEKLMTMRNKSIEFLMNSLQD